MEAVAYSNFRQNLKSYMKQVNEDADTLIVTSKDIEDTVVVLSKRDYDAMQETLRVLSNNYVMDKIRRGDQQFESGNFTTRELLEVEEDD
ncbi:type II toxin-antitoxin system Phd/YefM family antitoxin [Enterococcus asini]|uniref:Antitoxin n=1 Tax=Enterococcus dongliensis TaxID=2559925 RepID=A0AAW8TR17_9ENTE|nr:MULTISPECIES: type II toxin-antitoxin system Phd/YefM family antitoxin [Enterococcus]EMF0177567.1 type II toxin-antitoxin system Phd/YefM family antitoxin [Enterococcus hirae]HAR1441837.1 type II toxin-antitoxin system Phd/YefM family antitoxin [Enterococcus faecium]MDK4353374.1 type II toxin-antitoxin system Phd/YefM family antitoxin [Enterococcus thailandicus]MDT2574029.1 type II toxin-antitoxin system Phd/YefM family antitoxin [Enterococcus raffinosus]MDT2638176.1 type II toxin-antitoxin